VVECPVKLKYLLYHLKEGIKMDFPNSLQGQHVGIKKKSLPNFGFLLLFAVSVGLNFYLLFFGGNAPVEMAKAIPQEESANLVESQVEGLDPEKNIPFEKIIPPSPKVQKISFSKSDDIKIGDIAVQSLDFKVRNSLNYTVCKILSRKEGCAALSAHLGRLMSWFFDVNKYIRNDDAMKVVFQKMDGPEQFKILKLSYKSQAFGKTFVANFFDGLDQAGYFDLEGNEIAKRIVESQSPMRTYTEITSLPGDFRKGVAGHSGTDFKAPVGTSVYSGFKGKVTRTNWNVRANGYCVEIDHPKKGIKTLYLHLSRVLVKPGQTVKAGQEIAESGNTGRTFAPHLHYEIQHRKNRDRIYNPFDSKHHKHYTRKIPVNRLEQYKQTMNQYDSLLKQS
jgi:murein DD-endopeptidase MepM/ murein hydrolase activator NlpD